MSDEASIPSPLLSQDDFQKLCKDLLRSGEISSDGELSDIARQELSRQKRDPGAASRLVVQNWRTWIEEQPPKESVISVENVSTGLNPAIDEYPGPYGFDLRVAPSHKAKDAQYSEALGKLFMNQNRFVTVVFSLTPNAGGKESGLVIRALCIFVDADNYPDPVKVCYTHSRDSEGQLKSDIAEHLIRCSNPEASYQIDSVSGRHSVVVPFPKLQTGSNNVQLAYKFMDLGSCSGGLNRRETALLFTLEDASGNVLGRRVLQLRICTCPKRDMEQEEKQRLKSCVLSTLKPPPQPLPGEKRRAYWVLAYGKDNFDVLKNVGEALEKKDGGNVQQWNHVIHRFNFPDSLPKKAK